MAVGHVGIDGKEYRIIWQNYQKSSDNPFAAKLGQGAGNYDDIEGYSASLQDDWRGGIGKVEIDSGGTYASTLDTRFKNRMILPAKTELIPNAYTRSHNENEPYFFAEIGGAEYSQSANQFFAFQVKGSISATEITMFLKAVISGRDDLSDCRWQIRPTVSNYPDVEANARNSWQDLFSGSESIQGEHWLRLHEGATTGITAGDTIVIENHGPIIYIPLFVSTGEYSWVTTRGDGNWSRYSNTSPAFDYYTDDNFNYPFWFNGEIHFASNLNNISTLGGSVGSYTLDNVSSGQFLPHSAVEFQDELWLARGASGIRILDTSYATSSDNPGWDANILLRWNGYLYRAYERNLWYTADGSTWSGPFEIGSVGEIRGIAGEGNGNNILVSTDDGLFVFAEGDTTYGVTPWPVISSDNGREMIHHQGAVYIIVGDNRLVRYNQGSLLDVWLKDDDDKPQMARGKLESLATLGGILYATTVQDEFGAVFGWNGEGWHYIASLPQYATNPKLVSDRETNSLWVGTTQENSGPSGHRPLRIPISSNGIPTSEDNYYFAFGGWMETDWIHGGLIDLNKDWHSVYLDVDDFNSDIHDIDIYYQDDDSGVWKVLLRDRRFVSGKESIWELVRPDSKKIKIGLLVKSYGGGTPVIRAIRLKYQINVNDRWRWNIPIDVAESQEMLDGSINDRSVRDMLDHLEGLASDDDRGVVGQVSRFRFRDIDGSYYWVRVKQASQSLQKTEVIGGELVYNTVYYLAIAET